MDIRIYKLEGILMLEGDLKSVVKETKKNNYIGSKKCQRNNQLTPESQGSKWLKERPVN